MSKFTPPAPGQMTLERGRQLQILRSCKLGEKPNDYKTIAKALLRTIDDHIGRNGRWTIYPEQLFEEADVARSTGYKWLGWLIDEGLIGNDPQPDGRHEIWICWSSLWERTPEGRHEAERLRSSTTASPPRGPAVHHVDHESTRWTDQSTTWTTSPPGGLPYKEERTLSAPISAPSSSSSADDDPTTKTMIEKLIRLKVGNPEAAIRHSLGFRTADETLAIIEFFESEFRLPDGSCDSVNEPGFLYWRLVSPGTRHMAPGEGWKSPAEDFRRRRHESRESAKREQERQAWRESRLQTQGART